MSTSQTECIREIPVLTDVTAFWDTTLRNFAKHVLTLRKNQLITCTGQKVRPSGKIEAIPFFEDTSVGQMLASSPRHSGNFSASAVSLTV
jgi:hypothetical protein